MLLDRNGTAILGAEQISALALASGAPVQLDADLRRLNRWQVGGLADAVVTPQSAEAIGRVLGLVAEFNLPNIVLGDGSNVLFDDRGFRGVIIHITRAVSRCRINGQCVTVEAGAWVPSWIRGLGGRGLGGIEHAIGIPGTVGGLVMMNGGSLRMNIGQNIVRVRGYNKLGIPFERSADDCKFRYRGSTLQDDNLVVTEVDFALSKTSPSAFRQRALEILSSRRRKFPKRWPNCGSVFLSDPAMYELIGPPGLAIEKVGLKGRRIGGAQISPQHANFIVNLGQARTNDILQLIYEARSAVQEKTGFSMLAEVRYVSPDGMICPAHEQAERWFGRKLS
jgi:UDP-N-acetylmuramate dehydrogenase